MYFVFNLFIFIDLFVKEAPAVEAHHLSPPSQHGGFDTVGSSFGRRWVAGGIIFVFLFIFPLP